MEKNKLYPKQFLLGIVAVIVLLLGGCSNFSSNKQPLQPPVVQKIQEKWDTVQASRGTIETYLRGTANFVSTKTIPVYYKEINGRLKAIYVKNGDNVQAGDLIAELENDELEMALQLQKLNVERAELYYKQAMESGAGEAELQLRKIELEREKLLLSTAENHLQQVKLYAPIDGIVTFVESLKQGAQVSVFQTIAMISDPSNVELVYTANEPNEMLALEVGMSVTVKYKGTEYEGKVLQAPSTVPTRTIAVKAEQNAKKAIIGLNEGVQNVQIGHTAEISIPLQRRENTVILPKSAIRSHMGRHYVQIVEGERRKEVDIEAGLATSTEIEIVKGVEEGQLVVVSK